MKRFSSLGRAAILRAAALFGMAGGLATSAFAPPAEASISIAVQFDDLVEKSKAVATVTAVDQRAVWEGRYIITYTRLKVEDGIAGDAETGKEIWVVSRGGSIGDIGQAVEGEPTFHVGKSSLLFLRQDIEDGKPVEADGLYIVTARAQGMFPVMHEPKDNKRFLVSHAGVGMLVAPRVRAPSVIKPLAREVLENKTYDDARTTIQAAWFRLHERR